MAIILLGLFAHCPFADVAAELRVEGDGASPPLVEYVRSVATRSLPDFVVGLGAAPSDSTRVVLCASADEFARYSGRRSSWVLGVARPEHRLVALNVSVLRPGASGGVAGTLRHELAHLIVADAARQGGVFVPLWFNEGVASWIGLRFTELGPVESERVSGAPWLALEAIAVRFPAEVDRARLAYVKSLRAVELIEESVPGGVADILGRVRAGREFAASLDAVTGMSERQLDEATRARTRWASLRAHVLNAVASPYGWMALLVVVGFVLRRWRYRRRLAEWEAGE